MYVTSHIVLKIHVVAMVITSRIGCQSTSTHVRYRRNEKFHFGKVTSFIGSGWPRYHVSLINCTINKWGTISGSPWHTERGNAVFVCAVFVAHDFFILQAGLTCQRLPLSKPSRGIQTWLTQRRLGDS